MRKRTINLILAASVFASVAIVARAPRAVEAASPVSAPTSKLITRLVGQQQSISIFSTKSGVRYSVDADGRTILANATLDELRLQQPEAFRQIQSSIARTSDTPAAQPWAGVDMIDATDR